MYNFVCFVEKESSGSFPHFGFLVSKETVVLSRWESETKILVLSNELIKAELPPRKTSES